MANVSDYDRAAEVELRSRGIYRWSTPHRCRDCGVLSLIGSKDGRRCMACVVADELRATLKSRRTESCRSS